jgi:hypothetical protein
VTPSSELILDGGQERNRTADTGIFSLGRKFEKSILHQPLAALANYCCVISLVSQRTSLRHKRTDSFRVLDVTPATPVTLHGFDVD